MVVSVCKYIYIYIYIKYIKITAFQTSPVEKERNKQAAKFHMSSFKQQISGRNQNKNIKVGGMIRFQNRMNKIVISSLEKQNELGKID